MLVIKQKLIHDLILIDWVWSRRDLYFNKNIAENLLPVTFAELF